MKDIIALNDISNYLRKKLFLVVFLSGIVLGTVLINMLNDAYYKKINVTQEHYMNIVADVNIDNKEVFKNTFANYCKEFGLILIINIFSIGKIYNMLYLFAKGAGVGVLLSSCVMQYGVKGVFTYIMSIFPHYILYVPSIIFIIYIAMKMGRTPITGVRFVKYFTVAIILSILIAACESYVSVPVFRNYSEWRML